MWEILSECCLLYTSVKRSAVVPEMQVHEGPARVFDCEEDAIEAIRGGKIVAGDVVVIRYEGPKGGPGMREMLNPTSAIAGTVSYTHLLPQKRKRALDDGSILSWSSITVQSPSIDFLISM